MNIKNLEKIDPKNLKNINIAQIKEWIQKYPEIFINILLIPLTLFAIIYISSGQQKEAQRLKNTVTEMKSKADVVARLGQVQKEYDEFIKKFPQSIETDRLIDKISEFAVTHNVQITSYTPAKQKTSGLVELTTISINISGNNYNDIVAFIKDIEESPYTLKVEKWYGSLLEERRGGLSEERRGGNRNQAPLEPSTMLMTAELEINSLKIKND